VGTIVVFGVLPVGVMLAVIGFSLSRDFAYDFHGGLYDGARAVLHGHNPYHVAFLDHLAASDPRGLLHGSIFAVPVYPAPALVVAVPIAALPFKAAGILYALLAIAGAIGGLWLLGVRDWRCYGVALLTYPLLHTLRLGQVNGLLVLGVGAVWHWRRRLVPPSVAMVLLVAVNLFLWPLGLFMVFTRRWRVVALSAVLFVLTTVGAWALIGFDGLGSYPRMLQDLASIESNIGVSYVSAGQALGMSRFASRFVAAVITVGLLALAYVLLHREDGERRAYGLAVMAGLASSPVVWPHYFVLALVPIALMSPALSPLWLVPFLAYLSPIAQTDGNIWEIVPYLAIEALTIAALCFWKPTGTMSDGRRESWRSVPWGPRPALPAQPAARDSG
jgi:hypothetical protein